MRSSCPSMMRFWHVLVVVELNSTLHGIAPHSSPSPSSSWASSSCWPVLDTDHKIGHYWHWDRHGFEFNATLNDCCISQASHNLIANYHSALLWSSSECSSLLSASMLGICLVVNVDLCLLDIVEQVWELLIIALEILQWDCSQIINFDWPDVTGWM